jgi:hypothetical protein
MPQKIFSANHFLSAMRLRTGRTAAILVILSLGLCACLPSGDPAVPASVPGNSTEAAPVTASAPGSSTQTAPASQAADPTVPPVTSLCNLGELSASMEWQRSGGALAARLVLANFGSQACSVQGAPQIELANQNGWKLPVDQVPNDAGETAARVVLDPLAGYTTAARFVWRNWCTPANKENLHLEVVLPGYPGKLNVPVQDPNGHYLTDTPHCDDPSAPSTLTIGAFK